MSNIKEQIRQEIDTRRQHIVEELMGHEENCEYHRIKGMHDAYVDLLTFLDYSLPEEKPSEDLEEEVKRYYSDNFSYISSDQPTLSILTNVARHFAEWQKERMIKDAKEIITVQGSLTEPEFVKQRVIFLKED